MRRILWVPWLIIVVAWPATLLGWYYISLAADASRLPDGFLLVYLVVLLVIDSTLCVLILGAISRRTRAVLASSGPISAAQAQAAWREALRLPQRTALAICGLIVLTAVPITVYLFWLGEAVLVMHGWIAAGIVAVCELTVLFPLIQASTLPFLRHLKALQPDLRVSDAMAALSPQRAYFLGSLLATALVAAVLVGRLILLRDSPAVGESARFPDGAAIALTTLCFAAMFGGIGLQLHLSVLLPLRALARSITRFASGETAKPLGLPHVGEIGMLAEHFDDMVTKLVRSRVNLEEKEALLRHAQRFDAMGLMAASLVHELTNPLLGMRMNLLAATDALAAAGKSCPAAELHTANEMLSGAAQSATLMGGLLNDLKSFGRREDEIGEVCQLSASMEMALRIVRAEVRGAVDIERVYQTAPPVTGSALRLTQVFVNLLLNALEAMRGDAAGRIRVGVRPVGDGVEAWVSDNGVGISAETRGKLFEPLHSTKLSGGGLGLYVCKQIVESRGGRIEYSPNPEGGSVFRVRLPVAEEA